MNTYKALNKQTYQSGVFSIVPIRMEDRYDIMQWRNEQIYHLRQAEALTKDRQDVYFKEVISALFDQEQPNQILFSFLKREECIGYGGLVHINWIDKNAEISFIMDTALEKERFHEIWLAYLTLLELVAFKELGLNKIYTYAFDLRPHLYKVLINADFNEEARLKEHCFFENKFLDVVIHSKIDVNIALRTATEKDINLTYEWAANKEIRKYSGNRNEIVFVEHKKWFEEKINVENCFYLIAMINNNSIGSIRFDINEQNEAIISYLIDTKYQGKGYGKKILHEGCKLLLVFKNILKITGNVYKENIASIKAFSKLGFTIVSEEKDFITFEKNTK